MNSRLLLASILFLFGSVEALDEEDIVRISNFSFNSHYDSISGLPRKKEEIIFEDCKIKNFGYSFFSQLPSFKRFTFQKCEIKLDIKNYFEETDISLDTVTFRNCDIRANNHEIENGKWRNQLKIQELIVE